MKYNELIVLIPCHSLEDFPTELTEAPAASLLNGFAILWHPALLASAGAFPKWVRSDDTLSVAPDRLVVVPTPCDEWVPSAWVERARREGSTVIADEHDREKMLQQALEPLELDQQVDPELVADFLALGTTYLQIELLTRHMRNYSNLDEVHMQREALAAAQAALANDAEATRTHLGHCFEMLLECRERFYPVDCFMLDLCLVNPDFAGEELALLADSEMPANLLATADDWEQIVSQDPALGSKLREAIQIKRIEIIGGDQAELATPLMSLDSSIWQLRQGRETLQRVLGAKPTTWARKRFGLGSHIPQIADRFGYQGALHFVLDDGIYPDEEQSQLRWEGSDGTAIDAFSRIPLAADSAGSFLRFPVRMAESMDYDHTAAVVFARWPKMKSPWLTDLRRAHRYNKVLGKFVTFAEFFGTASSPGRLSDFRASGYMTLNLIQSVAREEQNPISRWMKYWTIRRQFEAFDWCRQIAQLMSNGVGSLPPENKLEVTIEAAHTEADPSDIAAADTALKDESAAVKESLKRLFAVGGIPGHGLLIINPQSFARRSLVKWSQGGPGQESAIRQRQIDELGASALVDLPPAGFVWLSAEENLLQTEVGKKPLADELTLRNEFFEVTLSAVTGGIASVLTYSRSPNRVSQQVAYRFPHERTIATMAGGEEQSYKTYYSSMKLHQSRVISAGPLIGEIETAGELIDDQSGNPIASYVQRTRIVRGRPNVDVRLKLELASAPTGDPWTNYVGCRFAWKHSTAGITGSMQQGAHTTGKQRIEAPQYIEIADESFRTTILTPGLPYYRMTGERMVDMLLITEGETRREFDFSIAIDAKYPMQAHLSAMSPPIVIPTDTAPPVDRMRSEGWLFFVGAQNVVLTRILPQRSEAEQPGFIVRLLETEGRRKTFPLRCFRVPQTARQVDFNGKPIHSLKVTDEEVIVEISPYEICDIELTF